jgi:hypothetical protein
VTTSAAIWPARSSSAFPPAAAEADPADPVDQRRRSMLVDVEAGAALHRAQHADQAIGDPVPTSPCLTVTASKRSCRWHPGSGVDAGWCRGEGTSIPTAAWPLRTAVRRRRG